MSLICFDRYGIQVSDLDEAKEVVEKILDIELIGRDSDWVGIHYTFRSECGGELDLIENIDHEYPHITSDPVILEPDFPDFLHILRVDCFLITEADKYKDRLLRDN